MSDPIQAKSLLNAAQRDLKALKAMFDTDSFADEIFGFHVQQAVEKSLKAWLSILGEIYPYTHDLNLLLTKLSNQGCDISAHEGFVPYSTFAAQVRYIGLSDNTNSIDRKIVTEQVEHLYAQVSSLYSKCSGRHYP